MIDNTMLQEYRETLVPRASARASFEYRIDLIII
jgi:hypothetical protein